MRRTTLARTHLTLLLAATLLAAPIAAQEPPAELVEGESTGVVHQALVPLTAVSGGGTVKVAGVVDHATIEERQIDGRPGFAFDLTDVNGNRLPVLGRGQRPTGLEQTDVVVGVGRSTGATFTAEQVLIPGIADWPDPNRGLGNVMVITMVVWLGLFAYVFWVHLRVRHLEGR